MRVKGHCSLTGIDLSSIEEGIYAIRVKNKGELIGISKFAR